VPCKCVLSIFGEFDRFFLGSFVSFRPNSRKNERVRGISYFSAKGWLRAVSTRVFWSRFRACDGADLQMDPLLCQIDAKLHRTINLAQSRARSRAQKREQTMRVETALNGLGS
jgi:hypothetical protein